MSYCHLCSGSYSNMDYTFGGTYNGGNRADVSGYDRTATLQGSISFEPERVNARMYQHVSTRGTCLSVPVPPSGPTQPPTSPPTPAPVPPTPPPTPVTCDGGLKMLEVNVLTDNYPGETSWQLVDTCTGNTVQSKAQGSYTTSGTQYSNNWCLPQAQYQFTINDSWGDGICCSYGTGSYNVVWDGAVVASGGAFGSSQATAFGSCSQTPPPTPPPTTANPTTANPTTAQPTTANPTTANPTTAQPTTANPTPSLSDLTASYDSAMGAPKCSTAALSCTTGPDLIKGTDASVEINAPNTLDTCADGPYGGYLSDESIESIKVSGKNGAPLQPGAVAVIEARVYAWSGPNVDYADFYYTSDANNPVWTYLGTGSPGAGGFTTFLAEYTIPNGSSTQAVRVNFRYGGSTSVCSGSNGRNWADTDDLAFTVATGAMMMNLPAQEMPKPMATSQPPDASTCVEISDEARCEGFNGLCKWKNRVHGCIAN